MPGAQSQALGDAGETHQLLAHLGRFAGGTVYLNDKYLNFGGKKNMYIPVKKQFL